MSELMNGLIVKSIAGFCYVEVGEKVYECKPRGTFRKEGISPVAGDRVEVSINGEKGVVERISERKNLLIRPPLANIDKLFIVSSYAVPSVNTMLIDRMIAIAEHFSIEPMLVFNKADLGDFTDIAKIYSNIGYKTFIVSAETGLGLECIKDELKGSISAFSGNSGVGKSSILNKIMPELALSTGDVSEKLGRGRHTTRRVELFKVEGGYVADTPGFSSFEITDFELTDKDELMYLFKEFDPYLGQCRFNSCAHITEPGCAVLAGVGSGMISKSRHQNYVLMYDSIKNIKPWELNKK